MEKTTFEVGERVHMHIYNCGEETILSGKVFVACVGYDVGESSFYQVRWDDGSVLPRSITQEDMIEGSDLFSDKNECIDRCVSEVEKAISYFQEKKQSILAAGGETIKRLESQKQKLLGLKK